MKLRVISFFYIRKQFLSHKQTFLKKKYETEEDRQNEK